MSVRPQRAARALAVAGVGVLAMLAAHCFAYQLDTYLTAPTVHPAMAHHAGGHEHTAHAAAPAVHAGHGHILPMASLAFLGAVTGCLGVVVAVRRRRHSPGLRARSLLGVQLGALALLELADRLTAGVGLVDTLADRRLWLGLAAQPLLALVVCALGRRALALVVDWFAPAPRPVAARAISRWWPSALSFRPGSWWALAGSPRGPPLGRIA